MAQKDISLASAAIRSNIYMAVYRDFYRDIPVHERTFCVQSN
jgi:hypothetical protein